MFANGDIGIDFLPALFGTDAVINQDQAFGSGAQARPFAIRSVAMHQTAADGPGRWMTKSPGKCQGRHMVIGRPLIAGRRADILPVMIPDCHRFDWFSGGQHAAIGVDNAGRTRSGQEIQDPPFQYMNSGKGH